jgi:hypothetical protein
MTLRVHLENGTLQEEVGIWTARDIKNVFITYGSDLIHCQMEVVTAMRMKYNRTPHEVEFKKTLTGFNYAVYKRGKK